MRLLPSALLITLFPLIASSHHSRAEYVEELELSGTLTDIRWRNPHPVFTLEVDSGGETTSWTVEGWSALQIFDRAGITQDRFRIGDALSVFGLVSERREGRILSTHMLLADGTEAVLRREADPYWGESETLGGRQNWDAEVQATVVDAVAEDRGIFRVWSYPAPVYRTEVYLPLTESAQAARGQWDDFDNYVTRCEDKGMPGSATSPLPYEFIETGDDTITIRGYEFDVVRTVYLNSSLDPSTVPPSIQGFSVGHWEDNGRTLVIHTSRIDFPYLTTTGIPLSEDVESVERYTLSDDQTQLDFHISITDPDAFTEPATYEYYWLALGEEFGQYDCEV